MHRPSPPTGTPTTPLDGARTLRLLGDPGVDVVSGDGSFRRLLGVGKPFALLAYLAVAPQHEASREFLADLLWGDDSVSDPLHNLRNTLLYLSTNVSADLIEADRSRCRLAHVLPSDLGALNHALQSHQLDEAMRLYSGEFLAGFAAPGCRQFERWCESVRLRVRTDVANAADVLVRQLLDAGRPRDAEAHARRMIEIDPLNQRGRRVLLETLIAAGDRMAALTEAAVTEQWLDAEEIEPEAATTALLAQARRVRPTPRSSGDLKATDSKATLEASTDLVGRGAEFASIIAACDAARAGTTALVSVVAGAGIGKTRLLADVENRLRAQRTQVVSLRALTDERDVPFSFVAALAADLARLPGAAGVSPSTGGVLVGLDSSLATVFQSAPDFAASDQILRRARALQELLTCVADERTTVLLLDDLHWADDASLAVLPAVLARLTSSRVLVVTASRPGRGAVLASDRTQHLTLSALTAEQISQLIASIRPLPQLPWSDSLVHGVFAGSRGVPVFALLSLRDATARGLVRIGESTWECGDPLALDEGLRAGAALPAALRDLPPRARRVLVQLAAAGRGLPVDMLADAAESAPSLALPEALETLELRALIARVGDLVSPAHDVVAESALESASEPERRAAARSVALEMLNRDDRRWQERGVRLFSTVATASELAPRLADFVRGAARPSGVGVAKTLCTWLGDSPEQRRLARDVARHLPLQLRLRPFRRHLTGAAMAASLFAAVPLWNVTHPAVPMDATLIGLAMNGNNAVRASALAITKSGWDAVSPLEARPMRLDGLSSLNGNSALTSHLFQRTGERLVWRVFDDTGGDDVEVSDASGSTRRLTSSPGDDVPNSWSPDGRYVALESSRWNPLRHHQIGILDRSTGAVRRLTYSDGSDGGSSWSPDGSRIAFTRVFLDERPSQFCIVNVDGSGERCTKGDVARAQNIGWRSPVEYIASHGTKLLAVRLDSAWHTRIIASDVLVPTLSPSGRWLAWLSAPAPANAFVAPSGNPDQARRVHWKPGDPPPTLLTWGAHGESAPYITRITVHSTTDTVIVGVPHRFEITARWSDSSEAPPPNIRWRLGSRGDGSIDSTGTLIAERPGTIVVVASAGGWRTTSTRVVAMPGRSRRIATENWTEGLKAWRAFGDPTPVVVRDSQLGSALLNNGDGTYFSGAYYRTTVSWKFGLAVDAVISTPVTELQWQSLDLNLVASDYDQTLARWDHRTGFIPTIGRSAGASCVFVYPGSEGIDGLAFIVPLAAPSSTASRRTLRIADGKPYRLRLQVFPDGRCGMAVNGAPLYVSQDRFRGHVPLRLITYGSSWKTRMLLGPLTIIEGVPTDIDWTHIVREIPPTMPPGPPESTTPRPPK